MSAPQPKDILTAIALLTRLPVQADFERKSDAAWAYPIAGAALSLLAGIITSVALWLGVAEPLAAGIYIAAVIVMSGAMHEDGLADCADGFWGGWEIQRRLEIMKDSQIGTYGVLALALSLIARWVAVWLLMDGGHWFWVLIATEALSRSAMPIMMYALPHARSDGLSHAQGQPQLETAALAAGIAFVASLLFIGLPAIFFALIAGAVTFGCYMLAQAKIQGQTGDVLGATQQLVLLALLLVAA